MNVYYRTGAGSHRHVSYSCANNRRALHTGDVIEMTLAEAADLLPCEICTDEAEVAAQTAKLAEKASEMCSNPGVKFPKRMQSECKGCGKMLKRTSGGPRAHKR